MWVATDDRIRALRFASTEVDAAIRNFFRQEAGRFGSSLYGLPVPSDAQIQAAVERAIAAYDWPRWADVLPDALAGPLNDAYAMGARSMWEALDMSGAELAWDARLVGAEQYARERGAEMVGMSYDGSGNLVENPIAAYRIDAVTRDRLQTDMADWLSQGMGWGEIAQALQDSYAFNDYRATTIARTETSLAYNAGNGEQMQRAGVEQVEIADGTDDEECADRDGQIVGIDESDAYDLMHPNCSVTIIAVMPEDGGNGIQSDPSTQLSETSPEDMPVDQNG